MKKPSQNNITDLIWHVANMWPELSSCMTSAESLSTSVKVRTYTEVRCSVYVKIEDILGEIEFQERKAI